MARRLTLLLQIATNPANRADASPHIAGWSESWWSDVNIAADSEFIRTLAQKRANLLPAQGSVIGFRLASYTIVGNKIIPGGSSTGKFQFPGAASRPCDLPQVALEMNGSSAGSANSSRFVLRGMPDEIMVGGEYQPDSAFKALVTQFCTRLQTDGWYFLGRDLTKPSGKVLQLTAGGGTIALDADIGAVVGDYIRLRRVFDVVTRKPIKGAFRVTVVGGGNVYTVAGLPAGSSAIASGTARVDAVALRRLDTVVPSRAVIKKVGRPFEQYRGRQSKRRA